MINLAVYENGKWSIKMKNLLEKEYSDMLASSEDDRFSVSYFVVDAPNCDNEISVEDFAQKYFAGEIAGIVIPKEYYIKYNDVVLKLLRNGVDTDDIYNGIRLYDGIENDNLYIQHLITPMIDDSYLSYLEYHIADHCNLNCKYCTHYSPLVKDPVFRDLNELKNDLEMLHKYIKDIGVIRILGGEPTLNAELPKFIEVTRKIYPGSIITVVTNGMLLDRISDELINAMKEFKAFFFISYYPPLENKLNEIKKFLVSKQVPFSVSTKVDRFNKTQSLENNNNPDFFYQCFQATCTCVHDGKLAPCYAPFTTKYFNEAFDMNLPVNEGIDLYSDELSLQELKLRLLVPMERCSYCVEGLSEQWSVIGKNSKVEDWV